jgi:nucleotide-binding universal stress UspA family protein
MTAAVRTRGLTGWARTVLGSEAAAIVRTSPVPVLVVPPHF